jgi:hypothetical protein
MSHVAAVGRPAIEEPELARRRLATALTHIVFLLYCSLYWTLGPTAFADFQNYVTSAMSLAPRIADALLRPEGLSYSALFLMRALWENSLYGVATIIASQQVLVYGWLCWLSGRSDVEPENLLFLVALLGPLLALITIRATPAYLLCGTALFLWSRREISRRAVVLAFCLAFAFHFSSLFYVVPLLLPYRLIASLSVRRLLVAGFGAGALMLLIRQSLDLGDVVALLASGLGAGAVSDLIAMRLVYVSGVSGIVSPLHYLLFLLTSLIIWRGISSVRGIHQPYLAVFYVMYCLLLLSPVAAVRISHYFTIPLLLGSTTPILSSSPTLSGFRARVLFLVALATFSFYSVTNRT